MTTPSQTRPMPTTPTHVVPKSWGEEHWIVNKAYCGKKLVLKKGHRCSLHYHKNKDEVFYVISGRLLLELGGEEMILETGDHRHVAPGTVHRFSGLEDTEIIEFSTHHEDSDSYRVEIGGAFDLASLGLPRSKGQPPSKGKAPSTGLPRAGGTA